MSEKLNITPHEAQDKLRDALEFGAETETITGNTDYRGDGEGLTYAKDVGHKFEDLRKQNYQETNVHYKEDDSVYEARHTNVEVDVRPTRDAVTSGYYGNLQTKDDGSVSAQAEVDRGVYKHKFSQANSERAASLVTSLAAKRIAKVATKRADEIIAAKSKYQERTSK